MPLHDCVYDSSASFGYNSLSLSAIKQQRLSEYYATDYEKQLVIINFFALCLD
jgi:hypothetical protein